MLSEMNTTATDQTYVQEVEMALLFEGLYRLYGFDFRNYSQPLLKRRVTRFCQLESLKNISALQERIFHDYSSMKVFVEFMTTSSATMFKDPDFYVALRQHVIPALEELPLVRIWQAGCSTGQEAYSLAILLEEAGIYDQCRIYATDPNLLALKRARTGIMPLSAMKQYTENYIRSGGNCGFSEYYTANYDGALINPSIRRNVIFGMHDFATDNVFNEFHMVLVRDVLVHLEDDTRDRALALIHKSMATAGVLALGKWETLNHSGIAIEYEELDRNHKLYRRRCA